MIDMTKVRGVLEEVQDLVEELDGKAVDDSDPLDGSGRSWRRREKAQVAADLQLLATRLELAAGLVRSEYWFNRGESDPLNPERKTQ